MKKKSHVPSVVPTNIEQRICDLAQTGDLHDYHQSVERVTLPSPRPEVEGGQPVSALRAVRYTTG